MVAVEIRGVTYKITIINNLRFFSLTRACHMMTTVIVLVHCAPCCQFLHFPNAFEILREIYFSSFGERYFWGNIKLEYQNSHVIIQ